MRDLIVGDTLDQYHLADLLARSGMASIFKAVDSQTGKTVALKVPHVQYESDIAFFQRFEREERIGQRLDHPNIVKVLKPVEKSRIYVAMEYVEGTSLRAMIHEKHPLPTEKALDLARQICRALVYLHEQGVVHRDMKPENVLVTAEGQIKILDFGIALDESARRLTWMGFSSTVGTPDYMAPEQIRGRRGDPRTDVYALGTILYEMLTGHLPYSSPNPRALLRAKTSEEARPPSYYVPGFPPSLEAILLKALELSPRDRYAHAAKLLVDLENPGAVPPRDASLAHGRARSRLPRGVVIAVVVTAIVAGLATLVWLSHRQTAGPERPRATVHTR